ncbi:SMI1/KNR4 family protein [Streptomyces chartreusis]
MAWVERLAAKVSWHPLDLDVAWEEIQRRLGVDLPDDFKEFCQCFGRGQFSGYLEVYSSAGGEDLGALVKLERFQRMLEQHPVVQDGYEPYGLFRPERGGLIPWGVSVTAAEYYWNAGIDVPPENWPVVAREEAGQWKIYEEGMAEFVYRILTDATFEEFSIAELVPVPFYEGTPQ